MANLDGSNRNWQPYIALADDKRSQFHTNTLERRTGRIRSLSGMSSRPPDRLLPRACRVVTSEISARILLRKQLVALADRPWTIVAGDATVAPIPGAEHLQVTMRREPAWADFRSFLALFRLFRDRRFNFVQTHTPKASLLGLPAARLAGQRTIYTMHGGLYFRDNSRKANVAGWLFERWCCSWAHLVAMQSAEDVEVLVAKRACPKHKARHLGNGIEIDHYRADPRNRSPGHRPVVLMIARLVAEKGCLDFFAVAEALADQADFIHVGPTEHDQRDAVAPTRIAQLEARQIVRFVGDVGDVRPYLAEADLFLLPSYREGIPRAAMEAAASGLPVVAYDIRGVREVVAPDHRLLVPRGDIARLIAATQALLANPVKRHEAATACRAHVLDRFDERAVIERLRAIYAEVVAEPARRSAPEPAVGSGSSMAVPGVTGAKTGMEA